MARAMTRGERQREGWWVEMHGAEDAIRSLNAMNAAVAAEVYNTFGYIGEVLRARLAAAIPAAGTSFPETDPKYQGRATGKARASVISKVRGKVGGLLERRGISVVIYPRARHMFMLGYGWREREIQVGGRRDKSLDIKARVVRGGKTRRRTIVKGFGGGYKRRHHLDPHPIAPGIVAGYRDWINRQVTDAVNRGTREAMRGSGS